MIPQCPRVPGQVRRSAAELSGAQWSLPGAAELTQQIGATKRRAEWATWSGAEEGSWAQRTGERSGVEEGATEWV